MNPARTLQRHIGKRKPKRALRRWRLKPLLLSMAGVVAIFALMCMIPGMALELVGFDHPTIPLVGEGLKIYDRHDRPVCTIFGERDQQLVKLDQISKHVAQAFLAAEDHDFYWHAGVNPVAITRAILVDITHGHPIQGGSTITQQLVKNLYFEGKKRGVSDKVTEAFLAMDVEKHYTKKQILEAYLNYVYFGRGVYGIQRASEQYFGKHPSKLSIAEAAFLAGLVTAPSDLSRPENRKAAVLRQQLTLNSMKDLHFITDKECAAAKKQRLAFASYLNPARRYRQYTAEVVDFCKRELNTDDVYKDGYRIYTNLDTAAQEDAERMLASGIRSAPKGINQGALVSISVEDGGVVAMVGGVGPRAEWNRATSPHTAGSAFKPFVYLAALSRGVLSPDAMVDDEPLEIRQFGAPAYRPKNYDGSFMGTITVRKALALSRNTCAVRVAQAVGPSEVAHYAHLAGITSKLDENLSLALGSSAVSPLEMANAYATLARSGEFLEPLMVRKIERKDGTTVKEYTQRREKVFDDEPVAELVDALQDVVEKGTGTRARLFDRAVAGKTGTSDAGKDIWFVGFTPDLVTAVWGGNDDNKAVPGHVTGGTIMAGIWRNYMSAYYGDHNVAPALFPEPAHPLLQESEPLQLWPQPSNVINQFFGGWYQVPQAPIVREYGWDGPRRYTDSDDEEGEIQRLSEQQKHYAKKKKKGLIRKLLDVLDF